MISRGEGYYDRPLLKPPAWRWPIPAYLFTGGLAGASSTLAAVARVTGRDGLARTSLCTSAAAVGASMALLVDDLGRPSRFLNMLRVAKVTSPMSVGTWLLSGFGAASTGAALAEVTGGRLAAAGRWCEPAAALLGPAVATYTAVLVADTAIPAWHESSRELPFVFAASAAASAGAAAVLLAPAAEAEPARRLAVVGAVLEVASIALMERRLGGLAAPYHGRGPAGRLGRAAKALTLAGAGLVAWAGGAQGRGRAAAGGGAALVLGGALLTRFSIFRAGFESSADPGAVVGPQRRRVSSQGLA